MKQNCHSAGLRIPLRFLTGKFTGPTAKNPMFIRVLTGLRLQHPLEGYPRFLILLLPLISSETQLVTEPQLCRATPLHTEPHASFRIPYPEFKNSPRSKSLRPNPTLKFLFFSFLGHFTNRRVPCENLRAKPKLKLS